MSSELAWTASTTVSTIKTMKGVIHHQTVVCQGLFRKNENVGATAERQYSIWKESGVGGLFICSSVLALSGRRSSAKFKCIMRERRAKTTGAGSEASGEVTGKTETNGFERIVKS